jgi:hypothetical protein
LRWGGDEKPWGYSWEWASLPPGRHGQPSKSMNEALRLFDEYLMQEKQRKSDLHVEYGFLEKFL